MAWLFERTVEIAAWVALLVGWVFFGCCVYWLVRWFGTLQAGGNAEYLEEAARSAGYFVLAAVAMGALACVDRFLYDADE